MNFTHEYRVSTETNKEDTLEDLLTLIEKELNILPNLPNNTRVVFYVSYDRDGKLYEDMDKDSIFLDVKERLPFVSGQDITTNSKNPGISWMYPDFTYRLVVLRNEQNTPSSKWDETV